MLNFINISALNTYTRLRCFVYVLKSLISFKIDVLSRKNSARDFFMIQSQQRVLKLAVFTLIDLKPDNKISLLEKNNLNKNIDRQRKKETKRKQETFIRKKKSQRYVLGTL